MKFIVIIIFLIIVSLITYKYLNIEIPIVKIPLLEGNGSQCVVIKNGNTICYINQKPQWITNQVAIDGSVIKRIQQLSLKNKNKTIIIPFTDEDPFYLNPHKLFCQKSKLLVKKYNYFMKMFGQDTIFFISCFYKDKPSYSNVFRLPWNDEIYTKQTYILNNDPISIKHNMVVWRGCKSGGIYDSLRIRIVNKLKNNLYADVKFSDSSNKITPYEQSKYKAILMIDGNGWPGSIIWNFLSGSVIIAVSIWYTYVFSKMIPWQDYIPCKPDLSDLEKNIELVIMNKLPLQKIADNGRKTFLKYFNPKNADQLIDKAII